MPNTNRVLVETAAGVYQAGTLIRLPSLAHGEVAVQLDGERTHDIYPSERIVRADRARTKPIPRETMAEIAAAYERQWKRGAL